MKYFIYSKCQIKDIEYVKTYLYKGLIILKLK